MSLRNTIQDLRMHAAVANDEHRVKLRTGQFAELSGRLALLLAELPGLTVGLAEVRQLHVELPPGLEQDAAQVVENLRTLATELGSVTIEQSLDLAKARIRSAEQYVSELRIFVAGVWEAHVNQAPPPVNTELVDALARGGVDVEEIRNELESARTRLFAIRSRTIPDEGAVEKFRAAIAAIHRCGERLGGVVEDDIAEGIVGAQEESGMPLGWFTPEHLEKLAGLGILDRFRVHLR